MTEVPVPEMQDVLEALETDRHQVANLERNRAWLSLRTHLYERRNKIRERVIREVFRKSGEPVDQRQVDYARGVIDTINWMLTLPERAKEEVSDA
jgi:hypothetical protein